MDKTRPTVDEEEEEEEEGDEGETVAAAASSVHGRPSHLTRGKKKF